MINFVQYLVHPKLVKSAMMLKLFFLADVDIGWW